MNKIKGYRNMLCETQEDWANLLGVTKQSFSQKETGIRNFKDEEKIIIQNYLRKKGINKTIDELFF